MIRSQSSECGMFRLLLYTERESITCHPVSMVINPLMATRLYPSAFQGSLHSE